MGESGRSHAKKLCVEAGEVMTTHIVLVFSELGKKKIHGKFGGVGLQCSLQGHIPQNWPATLENWLDRFCENA